MQREKAIQIKMTEENVQELWDNYKRCNIGAMGIPEGEERKTRSKCESIMTESFKTNDSHQSTDPESSETTKQYKHQKSTPRHVIYTLQKIKDKEKILKETIGIKHLPTEEQG